MKLQIKKRIIVGFGLAFVVVLALAFLSVQSLVNYISANQNWVHTHEVLREILAVKAAVSRADAEERNYLIYLDPESLKIYQQSTEEAQQHLERIKEQATNSVVVQQIPDMEQSLSNFFDKLQQQVQLRDQQGFIAAMQAISTSTERNEITRVEAGLAGMEAEEQRFLEQRRISSQVESDRSKRIIEGLVIFLALLLSGVFILIYSDIREYRRVVADLQESEERYRHLVEMSPEAIVTYKDGKIAFVNDSGVKSFGAQRLGDLLGKPIMEFIHPEDRRQVQERIERIIGTGQPLPTVEMRLIRLDGSCVPVEVVSTPISSGKGIFIQAAIRDISDRKAIETQVRLLSATIRSVNDCISITDLKDEILFVNEAFCSTYGYGSEELIGKNIALVRSPNQAALPAQAILPATLEGGWFGEVLNRRKDGTDFPVELQTSVVKGERGEPLALVGIAHDITQRKREEEERQRLISELREALTNVKTLKGLLPICASCKKIRDDRGYWNQIEVYVRNHSDADFSHSICPECMRKLYPEFTATDPEST